MLNYIAGKDIRLIGNDLGEVIDAVFEDLFGLVQLVPQFFFHSTHVVPGIHAIGLNIRNLLLVLVLGAFFSFDVLHEVSFFR